MEMNRYGLTLPSGLIHHTPGQIEAQIEKLSSILEQFEEDASKVKMSRDLTETGRRKALLELADKVREKVRGELPDFVPARKSYENQLALKSDGSSDPLLDFLREREIRDVLRGKDPLEVQSIYESAVASGNGDQILIAAVENAPTVFPLVDPAVIESGKRARMRRLNPEAAEKYDDLNAMIDTASYNVNRAVQVINEATGAMEEAALESV